ncbi:MAG: hypothetical protein ABIL22_01450 [candidate division WOR-3 bacterium]
MKVGGNKTSYWIGDICGNALPYDPSILVEPPESSELISSAADIQSALDQAAARDALLYLYDMMRFPIFYYQTFEQIPLLVSLYSFAGGLRYPAYQRNILGGIMTLHNLFANCAWVFRI